MVSRRCTQRQFLLRPDAVTNQTFLFCLAYAAQKTGVRVLYSMVMSNHHHAILHDPDGSLPMFNQELHSLTARALNAWRGRCENFWADEQPSQVELKEVVDVLDKIAYAAANPATAQLVGTWSTGRGCTPRRRFRWRGAGGGAAGALLP